MQDGSGAIDAQLTGVIRNGSLTISGAGVLTSTAANTLAGTLSISGAEFRLTGNGTVASITGVFVGNGGSLSFLGDDGGDTTEQLTNLTISGDNSVNIQPGATNRSMTVTFSGSLTRNAGATVNFTNLASGGDPLDNNGGGSNPRINFGTAPTLNDGILAYATVGAACFATVTTNFINAAGTTTTSLNSAATSDNVGITAATISVSADRTINSLRLDASSTVTIGTGVTLNIESGGLLARTGTSSTITRGTLTALGTTSGSDLIAHISPTATLSISSVLANNSGGSVGLTKANTGTLILSGSTANTLTGNTTVNGGTLRLQKSDSVTARAGNIAVGDNSGLDRLEIRANEQIANTANVTLNGSDASNRATLELGGLTETFAILTINVGNVCAPAFFYLDDLLIAGGSTLLVKNWIEFTTFLLVKNTSANTEAALPRIQFEGYGEAASWLTYDRTWSMIAPVPEPSTYGAILLGAGLAFVTWRRRRAAKTAA